MSLRYVRLAMTSEPFLASAINFRSRLRAESSALAGTVLAGGSASARPQPVTARKARTNSQRGSVRVIERLLSSIQVGASRGGGEDGAAT
jgi:hypothetical protein